MALNKKLISVPEMSSFEDVRQVLAKSLNDIQVSLIGQLPVTNYEGQRIQNVGAPQAADDAVTLKYLQSTPFPVQAPSVVVSTSGGGSSLTGAVYNETPSGATNGTNTTFTLTQTPSPGTSLELFLNGWLQVQGTDYTLAGSTITFTVAPKSGDTLRAFYSKNGIGGGAGNQDLLGGYHIPGTKTSTKGEYVTVTSSSTNTLFNVSGQSGYIDFMWMGVPVGVTLRIIVDGGTAYNGETQRFFAGEYLDSQPAFASTWFAFNQPSGMATYLPIPFSSSASVLLITGGSGATIFWEITAQTGVLTSSWNYTRHLHASSGSANPAPYGTVTFLDTSGIGPGRFAGLYWNYDAFPGSVSPATSPMEGDFVITVDGTDAFHSSGSEDLFAMSNFFQGFSQGASLQDIGLTIKTSVTWAGYRLFVKDPIVFKDSIKVTWQNGDITESTFTGTSRVAYCTWYYTET